MFLVLYKLKAILLSPHISGACEIKWGDSQEHEENKDDKMMEATGHTSGQDGNYDSRKRSYFLKGQQEPPCEH